ncbi:thymus-specific serine protease [Alligator mississippiensis]|uniref:thymus-specific serine protease n=1 Tax=Alligator mississippiensis TaxID=8496 RepID=UPI0028777B65|nr:thymus-specific serine protease [Alligator mississippiensis]
MQLLRVQVAQLREARAVQAVSQHALGRGSPPPTPAEGSLPQPLDHFDRLELRTFPQRFWINAEFWRRPDGPVFLYVGGESALSPFSVLAGHHVELGRAHAALVVALEHRFYGASLNADGLRDRPLRFLSSQQALADVAAFHQFVTHKFNVSRGSPWVAFGGSYPGALAAWLRVKFPHLIFAAVASSAPVRAQLDFAAYNQVVAASLSDPLVGGSTDCRAAVAAAFAVLDERLRGGRLAELAQDFGVCGGVLGPDDGAELAASAADVFMAAAQYNSEALPGAHVAPVCALMTDAARGDPYRRLVALNRDVLRHTGQNCTMASRAGAVAELRGVGLQLVGPGERQWLFQTCTEFGYYQTCEDAACPFSRAVTLRRELKLCAEVFGVPPARVGPAVAFTNACYGAARPRAARILFINGDIDPWHALSVTRTETPARPAVLIRGGSHCADMAPARPADPPALVRARQLVAGHLQRWLQQAPPDP